MTPTMETLMQEVAKLHADHAALAAFCPFPKDVTQQEITPLKVASTDGMLRDARLGDTPYKPLTDALQACADEVIWLEPYKGTTLFDSHMKDFACFEIIGRNTPLASDHMRSFVIYQPPHQHYPWHHHPAEEIYVVLAGSADFLLEGALTQRLYAGDHAFHPAGRPHALITTDDPVMAYVAWRDDFETFPVWTEMETAQ